MAFNPASLPGFFLAATVCEYRARYGTTPLAKPQVNLLMEDCSESIEAVMDVVREKVDLPIAGPACWHDRSWISYPGSERRGSYADINFPPQPKSLKDRIHDLLRFLRRD